MKKREQLEKELLALLISEQQRRQQKNNACDWQKIARDNQKQPKGKWRNWLILAGRGFGKTRTGSETVKEWVYKEGYKNIAIINATYDDVKSVNIQGESGLLNIHYGDGERPVFLPSKNLLEFPNGAKCHVFGAENPEKLRGPQFDAVWIDEIAKFNYIDHIWDQIAFSLRLGTHPKCLITTTPKPIPLIKKLIKDQSTIVTRGSTYDNAKNLSDGFINTLKNVYDNTRLGAQEIHGEILETQTKGLWQNNLFQYCDKKKEYQRILIAVDPAGSNHEKSDETGIIVAGICTNDFYHVIEDKSGHYSPNEWAKVVCQLYEHYKVDRVIAETNKGGNLVENIIKNLNPSIPFKGIHASRSKITRAEPVVCLYEQKKVFHKKYFEKLEHQACDYQPGVSTYSPDRMDALVFALSELSEKSRQTHHRLWL